MYIFEISKKRRIFDTPFDLIKKKTFHLLGGSMYTFYELIRQKCSNHSICRKTVFDLNFIAILNLYAKHLGVKITCSYCPMKLGNKILLGVLSCL
jgi:hypothetical protein